MSDMKPKSIPVTIDGQEFALRFTINVIDDLQEHFDCPLTLLKDKFLEENTRFKTVRYIVTALINEDIDCQNDELAPQDRKAHIDERWLGRHVTFDEMKTMTMAIWMTLQAGLPERGENDETGNPTKESLSPDSCT